MQDNIQNEITARIDNIAHEIIEAIRQNKREQINKAIENAKTYHIAELAMQYRSNIKCDKCFMKLNCNSVYDCASMALNYMKGVEQNEYGRNENTGNERSDTQED